MTTFCLLLLLLLHRLLIPAHLPRLYKHGTARQGTAETNRKRRARASFLFLDDDDDDDDDDDNSSKRKEKKRKDEASPSAAAAAGMRATIGKRPADS